MNHSLSNAELKIAEIIWEKPGISSMDTVRLCAERYGWKKSTVFTLIRRMSEKKLLMSVNHCLEMTISRQNYLDQMASEVISDDFSGSLPLFLTSFMRANTLSEAEVKELKKLISDYQGGSEHES